MSCTPKYYGGAGACKELPESIVGLLCLEKGHTAITKVNAKLNSGLTGLKSLIAPATIAAIKGFILDSRNGAEPSGGENELTPSNVNYIQLTNVSAIVLDVYANMSWNDYVNYFAWQGTSMEIGLFDMNGDLWGTNANATNFTGFRGKFYLDKKIAPVGADKIKAYHFYVVFEDMTEWGANMEKLDTSYSAIQALEDINPVGVDISVKTAMASDGDVVVKAVLRNSSQPYAGFTTADEWDILSSELNVGCVLTVVSAANAALGEYTINIVDGAAATPTGDTVVQASKVSTTMTYLSQALTIGEYTA